MLFAHLLLKSLVYGRMNEWLLACRRHTIHAYKCCMWILYFFFSICLRTEDWREMLNRKKKLNFTVRVLLSTQHTRAYRKLHHVFIYTYIIKSFISNYSYIQVSYIWYSIMYYIVASNGACVWMLREWTIKNVLQCASRYQNHWTIRRHHTCIVAWKFCALQHEGTRWAAEESKGEMALHGQPSEGRRVVLYVICAGLWCDGSLWVPLVKRKASVNWIEELCLADRYYLARRPPSVFVESIESPAPESHTSSAVGRVE